MQKRYTTWNEYLRKNFGEKIFKVPIDAGFDCPNRDGAPASTERQVTVGTDERNQPREKSGHRGRIRHTRGRFPSVDDDIRFLLRLHG